jgi:DNA-binding protein H-NS
MPDIHLDDMSLTDLKRLLKDVEKAIAGFAERQKRAALAAAEAAVREMGFSLSELVGSTKAGRSKSGLPPKYRHPENPSLTWSGRGRKPAWIHDALAAGKSIDTFIIRD